MPLGSLLYSNAAVLLASYLSQGWNITNDCLLTTCNHGFGRYHPLNERTGPLYFCRAPSSRLTASMSLVFDTTSKA